MQKANLYGADLTNTLLRYSNLRHADLRHCNLTDVIFRGADLSDVNLDCVTGFYNFDGARNVDPRWKKILEEQNSTD